MNIKDLLEIYKDYSREQGLHPEHHRTHLALLATRIGNLMDWTTMSEDGDTDKTTEAIAAIGALYRKLDTTVTTHVDKSKVHTVGGEKPKLYIKEVTDLLIHLLIYIGGNDLSEQVMAELEKKIMEDKVAKPRTKGRFKTNRTNFSSETNYFRQT